MSTPKDNLDFEDTRLEDADSDDTLDVQADEPTDQSTAEEKERASRMGWTDQDKYSGHPDRWVDAKTFIERGETILPILKDRLRKQDDDLKGMRQELRTVIHNQGEFERTTRQQVEKEFNERKRKAVEEADTQAYDEVHREEREWRNSQQPPAAAPPGPEPEANAILNAWKSENDWFEQDPELTEFADDIAGVISRREPHLVGTAELLKKVAQRTRNAFPDKFSNPNRKGRGDVEGSTGPAGGRGNGKKTYTDLPPAAKTKCDQYIENNWITDKAEYVATYFGEE